MKDRLEGIWLSDQQVHLGQIEARYEPEYHTITRKVQQTDSGYYVYSYKNDSILIEVKPYLYVTEYVFNSENSGMVYGYELDTVNGPTEIPRPRDASQTQFDIEPWGNIYRVVFTSDELTYKVEFRFIDDDQHVMGDTGSEQIVFNRVRQDTEYTKKARRTAE